MTTLEYQFSLTFQLEADTIDPQTLVDSLFEAGCDDAILGIGKLGFIGLKFIREANNAFDAVISSIHDVKKAIPTGILIEVSPDMGGISDIAEVLNCSRQNVRQLLFSDNSTPPPMYHGRSPIWHMGEVLSHFQTQGRCHVDSQLIDLTLVNQSINTHIAYWKKQVNLDALYPNAAEYIQQLEQLIIPH